MKHNIYIFYHKKGNSLILSKHSAPDPNGWQRFYIQKQFPICITDETTFAASRIEYSISLLDMN